MNSIVDIHTHTFPERIAAAALRKMQGQCHTALFTGATEPELTASMRRAGIDRSVILPVSTNPQHVVKVNDASLRINERTEETGLISFGCMHPDYDDVGSRRRGSAASSCIRSTSAAISTTRAASGS